MKIRKFFEYFKQNISEDDVMDIFLDLSDDYNCDIEVKIEDTSPFFCSRIQYWEKTPKIGRFEAMSKIIELKTGELISPKFIESYMSDYYDYTSTSREVKDYHKQFSGSDRYLDDIELIKKYKDSETFLIFIDIDNGDLIGYDFTDIFKRLKSMYGLDLIYFDKNRILSDTVLTTIMVV